MSGTEEENMTVGALREYLEGLPDTLPVNISVSNTGGDGVLSFWNFGVSDYSESGWVEFMMLDADNQELRPAEPSPGALT